MNNIININIYGDGSRKYPYKIKAINCDRAHECSLYKDGKCLAIPGLLSPSCCVGKIEVIDKSTKYARRCDDMLSKWKSHECYNILKRPVYQYIALVGNDVLINIPYMHINKDTFDIESSLFGHDIVLIPRDKFTPEYVVKLLKYRPTFYVGNKVAEYIAEYKNNVLQTVLKEISDLMPDIYQQVILFYPESSTWSVNYIGRTAYLSTCNRECTYDGFKFDGDTLIKSDWNGLFLPFGAKSAEIRIKVTDDMLVKITDNKQVLDNTKFV